MKDDPAGFIMGLEKAQQENYLGNPDTIDSMLRLLALEAEEVASKGSEAWDAWIGKRIDDLVDIMLGKNPHYPIIVGWNAPGGIDKEMRGIFAECGNAPVEKAISRGDSPEATMRLVFLAFVKHFFRIQAAHGLPGGSDDLTSFRLAGMFDFYTKLLMGLPPGKIPHAESTP